RGQPLGAQPARRARSRRPRGHRAGRDAEWQPFSARDARAVLPEPRPARLLLVPARAPRAAPGALRHRGNGDMSIGGPDMAPPPPPAPGGPRRTRGPPRSVRLATDAAVVRWQGPAYQRRRLP